MRITSKLAVSLTLLFFTTSTVAAAPAFEIFSGDLQMNGNNIDNIGSLSVNTALTDGNISESITLGASASVSTEALNQNGANSGQVLEWTGSQWTPADNYTQTLTVTNNTSQKNDQITISNGNTVTISDAYEANTDNQALSATNKSNHNTISLTNGGTVAIEDSYEANTDSQTLTVTNNTSQKNDQITLSNGNTVTISDAYEADTQANAGQGLTKSSGTIDVGSGWALTVNTDSVDVDTSTLAGSLLTNSSGALTISDNSLDDGQIVGNGLDSSSLESGSVGSSELASGAVTEAGGEIADGAVNSTAIKDGSVATGDLAFTPATSSDLLDIQDSGGNVLSDASDLKFIASGDASVTVTDQGSGVAQVEVSATDTDSNTTDISDSGSSVLTDTADINFADNLTVTDDTDGSVTVDATGSNTQIDDEGAQSNVNMNGNNITSLSKMDLNAHSGNLPACDSTMNGSIMYNGTHYGCNGTSWNALY
jgi:hypothetical protein